RVSLARAAYQNADVYLFDDPLSAVDAHVDQHLWQNLIGPKGLLRGKTRILVTHGINHLEEADQILVVKGGKISEQGHYDELMAAKGSFCQLIDEYSIKSRQKKVKEVTDDSGSIEQEFKEEEVSEENSSTQDGDDTTALAVAKADDKLVVEEKMEKGSVSWHVYKIYLGAASYHYSIAVVLMLIAAQGCQIGTNIWLEHWTNVAPDGSENSPAKFLGVYAALIVVYMTMNMVLTYVAMVKAGLRASERLHVYLLENIMRLPMSFFDTTPLGRIVNRFSTDVYAIDDAIPWGFMSVLLCAISVTGTIIVIGTSTPIFLSMVPPLGVAFVFIQVYYMRSSRALKRIDSISRSPIYQHFSETLTGVSTIRAMNIGAEFIANNASKTNVSANAYFSYITSNRWLQIRIESIGAVVVLGASLFAVLSRNSLNPSMVGLALSYALSISEDITWAVRSYCDLANQMVSVERIDEYIRKNQEAPSEMAVDASLPANWPDQGRVTFKNYSTRYRQGLELVIKNLSFEVQPSEKVGIVGRTGAGKSSLTLALFRIIEAANSHWARASHSGTEEDSMDALQVARQEDEKQVVELEKVKVEEDGGLILIDGVDISTVGLSRLRQSIAIIPQEPTLFAGSVRENLDPFEENQDVDLWEALERAHLKDHIAGLTGGLSYMVSQNGDNFSVGQRSLICLARALLRKTKILILDEATAAVDVETDELIQKTIRQEFKDRTILTIAHRIKTVMDSDKILVLEKGCVEEYESPRVLVQNKNSLFYNLAQQAGEINDDDEVVHS
ncbi:Multidrug resistance-associated protein 1, partial [Gryganskiella cystojenkinii]